MSRPYLIVPQLIEQPTWGGDYIVDLKGWTGRKGLSQKKIGQSYELSGSSLLATNIISSDDKGLYKPNTTTPLESVLEPGETMPLLIKLNQARGNSFQLHIKPRDNNSVWKPKPESWYFLEKGYISLGLNPQTSIDAYKKTCQIIERCMVDLSQQVKDKSLKLSEARNHARQFIKSQNPWQFVNRYEVDQFDLIDLSMGGIHHSWEEDLENTVGNVVYEVQLDVTDDESTMRSFDQGKIKDDGSIRPITIDDYFAHIDTNPKHNTFEYLKRTSSANTLLKTDYYVLERFEISGKQPQQTNGLWHHIYVQDGSINLIGAARTLYITKGHSCFIPSSVESYVVSSKEATLLITHLPE
jgi:mannose-6-phosphate isomerase class I